MQTDVTAAAKEQCCILIVAWIQFLFCWIPAQLDKFATCVKELLQR